MPHPVSHVFLCRAVGEIYQSAICWIPIQVARHHVWWTWADKRFKDQAVNLLHTTIRPR